MVIKMNDKIKITFKKKPALRATKSLLPFKTGGVRKGFFLSKKPGRLSTSKKSITKV